MTDLAPLRARLLDGGPRTAAAAAALRDWFGSLAEVPPAAFEASTPSELVRACEWVLRPRALELHDLLRAQAGHAPRQRSRPRRLWVALDRGAAGVALRLSAWRVDGPTGLAADFRVHAGASRDQNFRRAEAAASRVLEARCPGVAVRYSLARADGSPYLDPIEDGSLGAALAVAALAVAAPRRSPFALDPRGALTGTLTSDGRVGSVDQGGLAAKAQAARSAGVRRLVVPRNQVAPLLGLSGIRVREAGTVQEARRRLRVVRRAVKVVALSLLALVVLGGLAVHQLRAGDQDERKRELAAERAMSRALAIVDSDPRAALQLSADAARISPGATAPARSLVAAALPPDVRFLPRLPSPATAISWSPAGIVAATGTRLYTLAAHESSWRLGPKIPAHKGAAFYAPGRLLVGGTEGAWLVNVRTGARSLLTTRPVSRVAGGGGLAAVLTDEGRVTIEEGGDRRSLRVAEPHGTWPVKRVVLIAVTPAGRLVASDDLGRVLRRRGDKLVLGNIAPMGFKLGRLQTLAAAAGQVVGSAGDGVVFTRSSTGPNGFGPAAEAVSAILSLPGDRDVVLRRGLAEVSVVDGVYRKLRRELQLGGHYGAAAVSPGGRRLVLAGREVAVVRLDRSLPSPILATRTIAFDRAGGPLGLSNVSDEIVRLGSRSSPVVIPGHGAGYPSGTPGVSLNGHWAVEAEPDARVRLIDLWADRAHTFSVRLGTGSGRIERLLPTLGVLDDGRIVLSEAPEEGDPLEGTTYLVDPRTHRVEALMYSGSGPFSRGLPSGRLLLTQGEHLDLIRTRTMTLARRATVPGAYIDTVTADSSGGRIFFGTISGDIWSWTPETGAGPERLGQVDGKLLSLVADRNGSVLYGTVGGGIRESARTFVVDVAAHQIEQLEAPEGGPTMAAALSPDQTVLALSATDPIGAELIAARLTPAEACARDGGDISATAWRRAIGGLAVGVPECPAGRQLSR